MGRPPVTVAAFLVGAAVAGSVGVLMLRRQPGVRSTPSPVDDECPTNGQPCGRHGQRGECVLGRCVLGGGFCSQDVDCDDDNVCTRDRCAGGRCVQDHLVGGCKLSTGAVGQCLAGDCELTGQVICTTDRDCPDSANSCRPLACQAGNCVRMPKVDGEVCEARSGRPGICEAGVCAAGQSEPSARGLSFTLSPEKIGDIERKLAKVLAESYRYDLKVALVELPDGGYNIVTYNRRPHTDLRGLCDPSFIAWQVAEFTQNTNWKSRNLHIWIAPYAEGWALATSGSREAVRHGRAHSSLGWLGVMDAPAFREWLDKSFRPLVSVASEGPEIAAGQALAATVNSTPLSDASVVARAAPTQPLVTPLATTTKPLPVVVPAVSSQKVEQHHRKRSRMPTGFPEDTAAEELKHEPEDDVQ